ncbi:FkbM family methyltransferase [Acidiphilium sp.]|uniref:FkbM family methyltransferase n=1 Tax=Acidiphilium sp. TaxID=527 RepID=UPI003CFE56AD
MRSTLKSTFGAMFDSLGLQLAATAQKGALEMAAHLSALFAALHIDLVIDIGADKGQFGGFLRDHVGYKGVIASFEPIPCLFKALESRAAADEFWAVEQAALGAAGGDLPLNVIDLKDFRRADASVPPPARPERQTARVSRLIVPIRTLDEALPLLRSRYKAKHVFLKLNARGQDRDVFKGAEKTLTSIAAIQTELCTDRSFEGVPHYLGVLTYFQAKHFAPNGFFPATAKAGTALGSFDCCLVNTGQS